MIILKHSHQKNEMIQQRKKLLAPSILSVLLYHSKTGLFFVQTDHLKTEPFEIRTPKSPDFRWIRISGVQYSDGYCTSCHYFLLSSRQINKLTLFQSKFQILFSGSQVETARVLSALAAKESRKGFCLPCPFKLTPTAEKALAFYQSLPGDYCCMLL